MSMAKLPTMKQLFETAVREVGEHDKYGEAQLEKEKDNLSKALGLAPESEKPYYINAIKQIDQMLKQRQQAPQSRFDRIYNQDSRPQSLKARLTGIADAKDPKDVGDQERGAHQSPEEAPEADDNLEDVQEAHSEPASKDWGKNLPPSEPDPNMNHTSSVKVTATNHLPRAARQMEKIAAMADRGDEDSVQALESLHNKVQELLDLAD